MTNRFSIISVAAGLAVAFMLNMSPARSEQITLRLHTLVPPPSNPIRTFLKPWAERVEKASKGRLKIEIYPSMQLGGKPPQLVDQVKDGVVDIVWTVPGYTASRFPIVEVFELPFIHTDSVSTTLALQDFQAKHLAKEFGAYKVLLLHAHAGSLIMTRVKPIRRASDIKALKIRTPTRTGGWLLKALGAVPIGAPLPQIPQMMSKKVIDGALLPYEIAPAVKMQELANHFSTLAGKQTRMNTAVFSFLMNKASYAKLPADLKKVIDDHSGRNLAKMAGQNWMKIEEAGRKVMAGKKKNQFHVIPAAEVAKLKAAAKPVIARWLKEMKAKGLDGKAILADARAMIAKYSK